MAGYLADNNHLSAAISRVSRVRERMYQYCRAGVRIGTCIPVLCELEAGIQQTGDPSAYRRRLRQLLTNLRLWPMDERVARAYGQIYLNLKSQGRILSQVDMMLAAMASSMDVTVLTCDRDFEAIAGIRAEDWTK